MARPTTTKNVGEAPAPCCGRLVIYRESAGGHLKFNCQHCDHSGYSDAGGDQHAKITAYLAQGSVKEPETPPPAPALKKRAHFDLGEL